MILKSRLHKFQKAKFWPNREYDEWTIWNTCKDQNHNGVFLSSHKILIIASFEKINIYDYNYWKVFLAVKLWEIFCFFFEKGFSIIKNYGEVMVIFVTKHFHVPSYVIYWLHHIKTRLRNLNKISSLLWKLFLYNHKVHGFWQIISFVVNNNIYGRRSKRELGLTNICICKKIKARRIIARDFALNFAKSRAWVIHWSFILVSCNN